MLASYSGRLAETCYYSSNGGASESSENVWSYPQPYLVGKEDPYERVAGVVLALEQGIRSGAHRLGLQCLQGPGGAHLVGQHPLYVAAAAATCETYTWSRPDGGSQRFSGSVVSPSATGVTVTVTATSDVLFQFDCSGAKSLGVLPDGARRRRPPPDSHSSPGGPGAGC